VNPRENGLQIHGATTKDCGRRPHLLRGHGDLRTIHDRASGGSSDLYRFDLDGVTQLGLSNVPRDTQAMGVHGSDGQLNELSLVGPDVEPELAQGAVLDSTVQKSLGVEFGV